MNKAQAVGRVAGKLPALGDSVFVAPNATVLGDVKLGAGSSVWYGSVLRGACLWEGAGGGERHGQRAGVSWRQDVARGLQRSLADHGELRHSWATRRCSKGAPPLVQG